MASMLPRSATPDARVIPSLTVGPFTVATHDAFTLLALAVGWSKCFLRRPSYIIAFWVVVAVADAYWLFVLGQRLPGG